MANPALLLLPGNGVLTGTDRAGEASAVGSGALRYDAGKLAGTLAFRTEEGTTNLLLDPNSENTFGGGRTSLLGSATITSDTAFTVNGAKSFRVVTPGSIAAEGIRYFTAASLGYTGSARTFSGSAYVRGAGNLYVQTVIIYTDATVTTGGAALFTATGGWQRILAPAVTSDPAKTVDKIVVDVLTQAVSAVTFYVDAVQAEEKGYHTSYTDGLLGTGYAWTGAANASASTRAATTIKIDETDRITAHRGSIAVWFYHDSTSSSTRFLFSAGRYSTAGSDWVDIWFESPNQAVAMRWHKGPSGAFNQISLGVLAVNTWHLAYMDWDGTTYGGSVNNGTYVAGTREIPWGNLASTTDMGIGLQTQDTSLIHHGRIGPVMIFDRPLTTAERTRLYARTEPWTFGMMSDLGGMLRDIPPAKGLIRVGA